ncbi:LacI family DNA-binding transcriptional regulator [Ectobacillus ponti]|uniref:LacI family DNA-binding transcriptional regulator n=1 Tax=Ectobacillus ponti TaxID=2961894 RepID=A0AA41X8J4_9BACI|nr:LacI family DNA-binding transcriptional regulator [Ectobacillus ponti]MCP8968273.1 LacI family DNA-binding transcriptional regulator [Ectobacillus ponti]
MAVTIKDVARQANVAPSTVSRVIADSPRISEKTKKRVRRIMDELGYHPNMNARSLANQTTQALGVIMPSSANKSFQNPFFPEVIRGISSFSHIKDYSLYMSTGETEQEIFEGVVKMVQGKRVDGIVLLYSRVDDPVTKYLVEQEFPFVLIGKPHHISEDITYIDNDNYSAGREVTEYLISLGHRQIAFIGGSPDLMVTKERLAGYREALKLADLPLPDDYIFYMEFDREGGQQAVEQLMSMPEPPTAIVVTDDLMALGVLSTLAESGHMVPDEVSVASFNNVIFSELASPPLTSVDVRIFQLGYEAAKSLIERVEQPHFAPKSIIVPYKIVRRQTCKQIVKDQLCTS